MRQKIVLICSACLSRNYETTKDTNKDTRFEVRKYCPKCNEHTLHKETR